MLTINVQKSKQFQPIPPPQLQAKRGQKVEHRVGTHALWIGIDLSP